jgi:hypothetical protein
MASPGNSKSSPSSLHIRDMLIMVQDRTPILSLPGGNPAPAGAAAAAASAVPGVAGGQEQQPPQQQQQQQGGRPGELAPSSGGGSVVGGVGQEAAGSGGGAGKVGGMLTVCTGKAQRGTIPRGASVCLAALQRHGSLEADEEEVRVTD